LGGISLDCNFFGSKKVAQKTAPGDKYFFIYFLQKVAKTIARDKILTKSGLFREKSLCTPPAGGARRHNTRFFSRSTRPDFVLKFFACAI
jgi:hypothetical protein